MTDALRDELLIDPLTRGYSGMEDQAASGDKIEFTFTLEQT